MAIIFNTADIGMVNFNTVELSSVYYNGTEVWSGAELVDYEFPNPTAKLTANGDYGIFTFRDNFNYQEQDSVYAFDGSLSTGYVGKFTSVATAGRLGICLPFPIQLQSISIENASGTNVGGKPSGNDAGALLTANVHVSSDGSRSSIFNETSGDDVLLWGTVDRQNATGLSDKTDHVPISEVMAQEWIQSICINPTKWSSNWHVIGEVTLSFKVKSSDLETYGLL